MANFDQTIYGNYTTFGTLTNSSKMRGWVRIYGNTEESTRKINWNIQMGCDFYYDVDFSWGPQNGGHTMLNINGTEYLNDTNVRYSKVHNNQFQHTQLGLWTGGVSYYNSDGTFKFTISFNLQANNILWVMTGGRYNLKTSFSNQVITLQNIGAAISITSCYQSSNTTSSVSCTWATNVNANRVSYKYSGNDTWYVGHAAGYNKNSGTFTMTSFTEGQSRSVTVRAYTSDGAYAEKTLTFTAAQRAALSISNAYQSSNTSTSATIAWTTSRNIIKISYSKDGGSSWYIGEQSINKSSGSFSIGGYGPSEAHQIQLRAVTSDDVYAYKTITITTQAASFSASTTTIDTSSFRITWSAGYDVTSLRYKVSGDSYWTGVPSAANTRSGTITITGLAPGTSKTVTIEAVINGATKTVTVTGSSTAMTGSISVSNITPTQATVSWSSNVNIGVVYWKNTSDTNWNTAQYLGSNVKSGSFVISGLTVNKTYNIQVKLESYSYGTTVTYSKSFTTLNIATITAVSATTWNLDGSVTLTISNPGNCSMRLYISYNNIEIISRTNITLSGGKYTLTLTAAEQNTIYSAASGDRNPSFKFVLKSYLTNYIGEMSKDTNIAFPLKSWAKVDGVWKKAQVYAKVNNTWKVALPWVKVNGTWKRV